MKRTIFSMPGILFTIAVIAALAQSPLWAQSATTPTAQQSVVQRPVATAASSDEDIRDIRGPKAIPSQELWFLWLVGGAALQLSPTELGGGTGMSAPHPNRLMKSHWSGWKERGD